MSLCSSRGECYIRKNFNFSSRAQVAGTASVCLNKQESPLETYKTVPVWKREPVRVLSLFGNIKRGECGDPRRLTQEDACTNLSPGPTWPHLRVPWDPHLVSGPRRHRRVPGDTPQPLANSIRTWPPRNPLPSAPRCPQNGHVGLHATAMSQSRSLRRTARLGRDWLPGGAEGSRASATALLGLCGPHPLGPVSVDPAARGFPDPAGDATTQKCLVLQQIA